jgi:dihydropteroate synthase
MQLNPHYQDVVGEISAFFEKRLQDLTDLGIATQRTVVDPGIGFGKRLEHNLELLAHAEEFQKLGRPVCLGVSRKRFIDGVVRRPVEQRLAGSLAGVLYAMSRGAVQIVRVHDVAQTCDAVTLFGAIQERARNL